MWSRAVLLAVLLFPAFVWSQTLGLPPGPMQKKVATACTECHSAEIILQQRLSKPAWTKEIEKMAKWGALVDINDREALIDYLSSNFPADKPPYVAPRNSVRQIKKGLDSPP